MQKKSRPDIERLRLSIRVLLFVGDDSNHHNLLQEGRSFIMRLRQPFADQFVLAERCQTNTAHPPSAFAPINLFAVFFSCVGRESPNSSLRLERGEGQANKDRVL